MELKTCAHSHSVLAGIVAACCGLFASNAHSAQAINFGQNLPDGPIANGYAGFNWAGSDNDPDGGDGLTAFAASLDQMSRSTPFDLDSVSFVNYRSEGTGDGDYADFTTVIDGYRGNLLVKSVTEKWSAYSDARFSGIAIDGVNKITFSTHVLETDEYCCDSQGNTVTQVIQNGPDSTLVNTLKVSNYVAKAPELDNSSAAAALTFFLGSLAVLRGRYSHDRRRYVQSSFSFPTLRQGTYRTDQSIR
jgi:hypothetical protein